MQNYRPEQGHTYLEIGHGRVTMQRPEWAHRRLSWKRRGWATARRRRRATQAPELRRPRATLRTGGRA